jgi:o-succinylbenzoate---CoA ligase
VPRTLSPVDLAALPVEQALDLFARALAGRGHAVLPVGPGTAARRAADALAPGAPLAADEDDPADPTALVVVTSGSSGTPKGVLLPASALRTSAEATHRRLGGPGHWLLALPPHHVAGVQVLVRSLLAGTVPEVLDLSAGFDTARFVTAVAALADRPAGRRYTALVPTQLARLLDDNPGRPGAVESLQAFDAVLLGGAAAPQALLRRAAAAGVRVVTTYGMTETCGGCVYDGLPLDGVRVTLAGGGVIRLAGPVVARGYRRTPQAAGPDGADPRATPFDVLDGVRRIRTNDLGRFDGERLRVLGRADDVIVTGGVKVSPQAVEDVLRQLPGVDDCLVVGVPDDQWGRRVEVLVVGAPPSLDSLRDQVSTRLGRAAAPRAAHVVDTLPTLGVGKPDRAQAARLAARRAEPAEVGVPSFTRGDRHPR